jgi:hypothetical protein
VLGGIDVEEGSQGVRGDRGTSFDSFLHGTGSVDCDLFPAR